jgi:hypothetical protein
MKKLLGTDTVGSYTFNPVAKTVTFSNLQQALTLANILLITNTTANTIIYNFADPTTGAISFNNNILTLDYDTSSMNSSDILQIYVDVESYEESLHTLLRRMNKILESNSVVDLQQRQRITIDALRTSATATTDLTGTIPVSGTVTASASGTYTVNNSITNQVLPSSSSNPYSLSAATSAAGIIMEGPVHQIWRIIDDSRSLYSNAIRSKLTFS